MFAKQAFEMVLGVDRDRIEACNIVRKLNLLNVSSSGAGGERCREEK